MRKTSQELDAELAELRSEREVIAARMAADKKRLKELDGDGWHDAGEIARTKASIARAQLWEADDKLPRVRVQGFGFRNGCEERVVRKITPKRIYLAVQGNENETQYSRDGGDSGFAAIHPDDLKRILEVDNG